MGTSFNNQAKSEVQEDLQEVLSRKVSKALREYAAKMKEELVSKKAYTYSDSWKQAKYKNSTAKRDTYMGSPGNITTGSPYFIGSSTGTRIFGAFQNDSPVIRPDENGSMLNVKLKMGDRGKMRGVKTNGKRKESLIDIFLPKKDAPAKTTKNGLHQIAFYDDLYDYHLPQIKQVIKESIRNSLVEIIKRQLKEQIRSGAKNYTSVTVR